MRSYVPTGSLAETAARAAAPASQPAVLEGRRRVARLVLGGQGGGQPRPGALQPLLADRGEPLATFPELERFLQGEAPAFQPPHHLDELITRLLVRHLCGGRSRRSLVSGGLAVGRLVAGARLAGGLAARRAAAALRLTRLGGHGAKPSRPSASRARPSCPAWGSARQNRPARRRGGLTRD